MKNKNSLPDRKYISPDEACEHIGVGKSTVLEWLRENKMPGVKINGIWRLEKEYFLNWIQSCENEMLQSMKTININIKGEDLQ